MRHHRDLIDMRMHGEDPAVVYVDTDPSGIVKSRAASLWVEGKDAIRRLDLRCLVGMNVIVNGSDPVRVKQAFEAAQAAGAGRVRAFLISTSGQGEFMRYEAAQQADTQGEIAWQ